MTDVTLAPDHSIRVSTAALGRALDVGESTIRATAKRIAPAITPPVRVGRETRWAAEDAMVLVAIQILYRRGMPAIAAEHIAGQIAVLTKKGDGRQRGFIAALVSGERVMAVADAHLTDLLPLIEANPLAIVVGVDALLAEAVAIVGGIIGDAMPSGADG